MSNKSETYHFNYLDTSEHSYDIGFDLTLYNTEEGGIVVVARSKDSPEGTDYVDGSSKQGFLEKFPTLEDLLKAVVINPEWNEPNVKENMFHITSLTGFQGFYDFPKKSPIYILKNENLTESDILEIESLGKPFEKTNEKNFHVYSKEKVNSEKLAGYELFECSLKLFKTVDTNGCVNGVLYVAHFVDVDMFTINHIDINSFENDFTLSDLLEDIHNNNHCVDDDGSGNPGILIATDIECPKGMFRKNKYAPYFKYEYAEDGDY